MVQDNVDTDSIPVPIYRDHGRGPQRWGRRLVIAATYIRRQKDRETLQRQLDLVHAHADLNGKKFMRKNRRMRNKNGTLMQRSFWCKTRGYSRLSLGTITLGAAIGMVMETTVTLGIIYLYFR